MAKHFHLDITDHSWSATPATLTPSHARPPSTVNSISMRTSLPPSDLDAPGTVTAYKLPEPRRGAPSGWPQNRRPQGSAPFITMRRNSGPRPRLVVHARLLPRMAHASQASPPCSSTTMTPLLHRTLLQASPRQPPLPLLKKRLAPSAPTTAPPIHSFRTLLDDLATIAKNRLSPACLALTPSSDLITRPTPLQGKAFDLLGVPLERVPGSRSTGFARFSRCFNEISSSSFSNFSLV